LYCIPTDSEVVGDAVVAVTTDPASPATMFEWASPSGIVKLPEASVVPEPMATPSAQTESVVAGSHGTCTDDTGLPE
jgi:hypothetical protein